MMRASRGNRLAGDAVPGIRRRRTARGATSNDRQLSASNPPRCASRSAPLRGCVLDHRRNSSSVSRSGLFRICSGTCSLPDVRGAVRPRPDGAGPAPAVPSSCPPAPPGRPTRRECSRVRDRAAPWGPRSGCGRTAQQALLGLQQVAALHPPVEVGRTAPAGEVRPQPSPPPPRSPSPPARARPESRRPGVREQVDHDRAAQPDHAPTATVRSARRPVSRCVTKARRAIQR
jgi:hypothetical protein